MKSAAFEYARPESLQEAVELLDRYGDDAKVLAGGQSLLAMMNLRVAQPAVLVDIAGCGLAGIRVGDTVDIGAMATQNAALHSAEVAGSAPLLTRALADVSHHALRNRGTVGGCVAHADPAAEVCAALLALDGEVLAEGPRGARVIPADGFFVTHYTTALEDDEVLTALRLPGRPPDAWAFHELTRRHGDYAIAGVAAAFDLAADATVADARIVLFAVADRPVRATAAEDVLRGRMLSDRDAIAAAGAAASQSVDPTGDLHGSGEYRKRMIEVVVRRALVGATTSTEVTA